MAFWDSKSGIAISDPIDGRFLIILTEDGGETWRRIPHEKSPLALPGEACFAASGTCIAVQGKDHVWFATGGSTARVFRSTDHGQTWKVTATPMLCGKSSQGIFSVDFWDEKNGLIVGGDYKNIDSDVKNAAVTSDGGVTWKLIETSQPAGYRECVVHLSGTKGSCMVTVGPSGSDFSRDGGRSWINFDKNGFHSLSFAPSAMEGWAVGADGIIARFIRQTTVKDK